MNNNHMDLYEVNTHPFIVKVWLEETESESERAVWRGHITHVPSGKQCYFQNLDVIADFVASYLEAMGAKFD